MNVSRMSGFADGLINLSKIKAGMPVKLNNCSKYADSVQTKVVKKVQNPVSMFFIRNFEKLDNKVLSSLPKKMFVKNLGEDYVIKGCKLKQNKDAGVISDIISSFLHPFRKLDANGNLKDGFYKIKNEYGPTVVSLKDGLVRQKIEYSPKGMPQYVVQYDKLGRKQKVVDFHLNGQKDVIEFLRKNDKIADLSEIPNVEIKSYSL